MEKLKPCFGFVIIMLYIIQSDHFLMRSESIFAEKKTICDTAFRHLWNISWNSVRNSYNRSNPRKSQFSKIVLTKTDDITFCKCLHADCKHCNNVTYIWFLSENWFLPLSSVFFHTQGLTPLIGYVDSITWHAWLARNKSTAPNSIRQGVGQTDTSTNMEKWKFT